MIVLGIDHRRTHTAVCLREGPAPTWPPVSVGDGRRALIANAVAGAAWGGDALARPVTGRYWAGEHLSAAAAFAGGPGPPAFWDGLARRVADFLGRVPGSARVALTGEAIAPHALREAARAAGLGEPACLPSGRAALVAALHGGELRGGDAAAVVAVLGDCRADVFAYRLEWDGGLPRVVTAACPVVITATGAALWCREVLLAVRARCPSAADPRHDAVLWPAAAEFGARLGDADDGETLEWTGPLSEQMPAPLQFSRDACLAWDSVARLRTHFPRAVTDVAAEIGAPEAALLVSGPGARWPFLAGVVTGRTLDAPELAAARGAAWWTDLSESLFTLGLQDEQPARPVEALGARRGPTAPEPRPAAPADRAASAKDDWGLLSEFVDHQGGPGD